LSLASVAAATAWCIRRRRRRATSSDPWGFRFRHSRRAARRRGRPVSAAGVSDPRRTTL